MNPMFVAPMSLRPFVLVAAGLSAVVALAADPVDTPASPSVRQQGFAVQIARARLAQQDVAEPSAEQLALATADVQALRDQGMGWGEIANRLGLRLGAVVSGENRADRADERVAMDRRSEAHDKAHGSMSSAAGGQGGGSGGQNGGGGKGGGGGKR